MTPSPASTASRTRSTGKLVVATSARGGARGCAALADRGAANGVPARLVIGRTRPASYEPHVACVAALHVDDDGHHRLRARSAGRTPRMLAERGGGLVRLRHRVRRRRAPTRRAWRVARRPATSLEADAAGQLRRACTPTVVRPGLPGSSRRRGSCRSAASTSSCARHRGHLVRGLIYPVPGSAVPVPRRAPDPDDPRRRPRRPERRAGAARARGTRGADVDLGDLRDALAWPGFWRLAPAALAVPACARGGPVAVAARVRAEPGPAGARDRARRPRAGAGGRAGAGAARGTARWSTTSWSQTGRARCTSSTRPRPRPRRRWRSPTTWSPRSTRSPALRPDSDVVGLPGHGRKPTPRR